MNKTIIGLCLFLAPLAFPETLIKIEDRGSLVVISGPQLIRFSTSWDLKRWDTLRVTELYKNQDGAIEFPLRLQSPTDASFVKIDYIETERLNGTWTGSIETHQVGDCSINGSNVKIENLQFEVSLDQNLNLTLELYDPTGEFHTLGYMAGSVEWPGDFSSTRTSEVRCNETIETHTHEYAGQLFLDTDTATISFLAREVWCQSMNCVFDVHYILSKEIKKGKISNQSAHTTPASAPR